MKLIQQLTTFALVALTCPSLEAQDFKETFDNLKQWADDSTPDSHKSHKIQDGKLYLSTRPDTKDRVKSATKQRFGAGTYTWRVYVPEMGLGDQASIGAFIYRDDKHEVDFEIGSGTKKLREKLKAGPEDLVCYCTTQGHPYSTTQVLLKRKQWYTLSIEMKSGKNGKYAITWKIDGKEIKTMPTRMDHSTTFTAHVSVENLRFMGDHLPKVKNWAWFDSFEFAPQK